MDRPFSNSVRRTGVESLPSLRAVTSGIAGATVVAKHQGSRATHRGSRGKLKVLRIQATPVGGGAAADAVLQNGGVVTVGAQE